jgi:hypothetical protein
LQENPTSGTANRCPLLFRPQSSPPSFIFLMKVKAQQLYWQNEPEGSLDQQYWARQGWLDPQRDFYVDHQANPIKVVLARLSGAVIARFVS